MLCFDHACIMKYAWYWSRSHEIIFICVDNATPLVGRKLDWYLSVFIKFQIKQWDKFFRQSHEILSIPIDCGIYFFGWNIKMTSCCVLAMFIKSWNMLINNRPISCCFGQISSKTQWFQVFRQSHEILSILIDGEIFLLVRTLKLHLAVFWSYL